MLKTIAFISSLLLNVLCFAQSTFFKVLGDTAFDELPYSIIETPGNNYFISLASPSNKNSGVDDICIYKLNEKGVLLDTFYYGGAGGEYAPKLINANDGGVIIYAYSASYSDIVDTGWVSNEDGTWIQYIFYPHLYVTKIDEDGKMIFHKNYGDQKNYQGAEKIISSGNDSYLMLAADWSDDGNGCYLVKADNNGDTLWTKRILFPNDYSTYFGDIMMNKDSSSYYISGVVSSKYDSPFNQIIVNVSKDGETNWIWRNHNPDYSTSSASTGFMFRSGDHYVLTGHKWINFSEDTTTISVKTDLPSTNLYLKKIGDDLSRFWIGNKRFSLQLYDSTLSNLQSNDFYSGDYKCEGRDYIKTKDGGFAIVARAQIENDMNRDQFLFIKTDSLLQVSGYNKISSLLLPKENRFTARMNDAIIIGSSFQDNKTYQYELYNLEGKKLQSGYFKNNNSSNIVNYPFLQNEILLLRIYNPEESFEQTFKLIQFR
jgi:hypothetical protein